MTNPDTELASGTRPTPAAPPARAGVAGDVAQMQPAETEALPTSFGVFKPVGHVMTGLPTQAQIDALASALRGAGWPATGVRQFSPRESVAELRAMVDNAGLLAGFGYEITLLKRYLALAEQGTLWLLVQAGDSEQAATVAETARRCGATLAVHYRTLTVEELIP
jgi:hypothetical protein